MSKRKISPEAREKSRLANFGRWLEAAWETHGNRFDYSRAKETFRAQKKLVCLYCKTHDQWFETTAANHLRLQGGGCKLCGGQAKGNSKVAGGKASFHEWLVRQHGERLEMVGPFMGMTSPTEFLCKIHGTIKRTKPTTLRVNGYLGCNACSREAQKTSQRLTLELLICEIGGDLPDHVALISTDATDQGTRFNIDCEFHGEQKVSADYLRQSPHKCPKCGRLSVGYAGERLKRLINAGEVGRSCQLGVMEVSAFEIETLKVGVTLRTLKARYGHHLNKIFYSVDLPEKFAYIIENKVHREFYNHHDMRVLTAGMRSGKRWSGDTELYWPSQKDRIIDFIERQRLGLQEKGFDDQEELSAFIQPKFFERDVGLPKSLANKPVEVVGIDPETREVVARFDSISEATRAGYKNVGIAMHPASGRIFSGGLRWFRANEFDPDNVPEMGKRYGADPVICVETNEVFRSAKEAEQVMRSRGFAASMGKILMAAKGTRSAAGGYKWRRAKWGDYARRSERVTDPHAAPSEPPKNALKTVEEYDPVTAEVLAQFPSVSEAARSMGSKAGSLSVAMSNGRPFKGRWFRTVS